MLELARTDRLLERGEDCANALVGVVRRNALTARHPMDELIGGERIGLSGRVPQRPCDLLGELRGKITRLAGVEPLGEDGEGALDRPTRVGALYLRPLGHPLHELVVLHAGPSAGGPGGAITRPPGRGTAPET